MALPVTVPYNETSLRSVFETDMTYLAFRNLFQQKFRLALSVSRVTLNPVCGMSVDRDSAPACTEYEGQVYYFCANGCREEFLAYPAKFLAGMEMSRSG